MKKSAQIERVVSVGILTIAILCSSCANMQKRNPRLICEQRCRSCEVIYLVR